MKTTNVKQSKKNSGWFLAIPHEDEKGFEALAYLRKNGYFNTPLYRLNKNKSQKQITRYYLRYPQREEGWRYWVGLSVEEQAKAVDRKVQYHIETLEQINERLNKELQNHQEEISIRENLLANLEPENERLKQRVAQLEAENAKLRTEAYELWESPKYAPRLETANADEYPKWNPLNPNFVTPDMSATLGRGTHVLIDIDKVPKDLQVLLAKMMDALNDHTLRISQLENC